MKRIMQAVAVVTAMTPLLTPVPSRAQQQQMTINVPVIYENFDPSWKMKLSTVCHVWYKTGTGQDWRGLVNLMLNSPAGNTAARFR
jgi:hypothetical protein